MTQYATGEQLRALTAMIQAERDIQDVTERELRAWVKKFLSKLQELNRPGIAPDLTALEYLREDWSENHLPEILAVAALAWKKRYKRKRKNGYNDKAEALFLSQTRETLILVPNRTFQVAQSVIDKGVLSGITVNDIIRSIETEVLAPVTITSERTGRLVGPSVINDASLSAALDSEEIDHEGPYVKSWVSVHDLHVRPTHVYADQNPANQGIPLRAKFNTGGWLCDHPRDSDLPLEESMNCRCIADIHQA